MVQPINLSNVLNASNQYQSALSNRNLQIEREKERVRIEKARAAQKRDIKRQEKKAKSVEQSVAIGTVVGTIAGAYFGSPTIGAAAGAALGGTLGGAAGKVSAGGDVTPMETANIASAGVQAGIGYQQVQAQEKQQMFNQAVNRQQIQLSGLQDEDLIPQDLSPEMQQDYRAALLSGSPQVISSLASLSHRSKQIDVNKQINESLYQNKMSELVQVRNSAIDNIGQRNLQKQPFLGDKAYDNAKVEASNLTDPQMRSLELLHKNANAYTPQQYKSMLDMISVEKGGMTAQQIAYIQGRRSINPEYTPSTLPELGSKTNPLTVYEAGKKEEKNSIKRQQSSILGRLMTKTELTDGDREVASEAIQKLSSVDINTADKFAKRFIKVDGGEPTNHYNIYSNKGDLLASYIPQSKFNKKKAEILKSSKLKPSDLSIEKLSPSDVYKKIDAHAIQSKNFKESLMERNLQEKEKTSFLADLIVANQRLTSGQSLPMEMQQKDSFRRFVDIKNEAYMKTFQNLEAKANSGNAYLEKQIKGHQRGNEYIPGIEQKLKEEYMDFNFKANEQKLNEIKSNFAQYQKTRNAAYGIQAQQSIDELYDSNFNIIDPSIFQQKMDQFLGVNRGQ